MGEPVPPGGDIIAGPARVTSVHLDKGAPRGDAPASVSGRGAPAAPASREQVEALAKAVDEVLTCLGFGDVACTEMPGTANVAATPRHLTVIGRLSPAGRGDLHDDLVFGFESTVARAFAGRIAVFMFGEPREAPADEEPGFIRFALGEMASFTLLATLNSLGLLPEPPQTRFVEGEGVELWPTPRAAKGLCVTTDAGAFEVAFVSAPPGPSPQHGRD
ncbi:MAG: hypothetical protein ACYTKD_24595 [Planctomycetota bacterium]